MPESWCPKRHLLAFILTLPTPVQLCYIAAENTGIQSPTVHSHERRIPYLLTTSISGVCCNTPAPLVTPVLLQVRPFVFLQSLPSCNGGIWHPPTVTDLESSQLSVCKLHCPTDPPVALPFRSTDVPWGSQPINIDLFFTKPFHLEKCVSQVGLAHA